MTLFPLLPGPVPSARHVQEHPRQLQVRLPPRLPPGRRRHILHRRQRVQRGRRQVPPGRVQEQSRIVQVRGGQFFRNSWYSNALSLFQMRLPCWLHVPRLPGAVRGPERVRRRLQPVRQRQMPELHRQLCVHLPGGLPVQRRAEDLRAGNIGMLTGELNKIYSALILSIRTLRLSLAGLLFVRLQLCRQLGLHLWLPSRLPRPVRRPLHDPQRPRPLLRR